MTRTRNRRIFPDNSHMDDPENLPIETLLANLETDCHFRLTKIRQASSMKDVAQLKDVPLRGKLRDEAFRVSALKQLEVQAEQRMQDLLMSHYMELRRQTSVAALDAARHHFMSRDWSYMKAAFPKMYREAEMESERMLRRLERETETKRAKMRGKK